MRMINVPPTPDHAEADLGAAAGVSDRGLRHPRNEDAMALGSEQTPDGLVVVAVVCDGVSSSPRPAVVAARESVAALREPENERSATTFLSAVAARDEVILCWLGDSRAYW